MVKKILSAILLFLLIASYGFSQKEIKHVETKLTKQIKKLVASQKYDEAYNIVLQNKKSLGFNFHENFSHAYHNSQWIDTISVDSSCLFSGTDKLPCQGLFIKSEYTTEKIEGVTKRVLIKKGAPSVQSFNHFGNFVKLSDSMIRKIKRKMKKKGWYKGRIDKRWNDYVRRQLIYHITLENNGFYPINMYDKNEIYAGNLLLILPPKPVPEKIAKQVGYKNARRVTEIKITNHIQRVTITESKSIQRFVRLLSRLKKTNSIKPNRQQSVEDYWIIDFHYRTKNRQRTGKLHILKSPNGPIASSKITYYRCTKELMEFIHQL